MNELFSEVIQIKTTRMRQLKKAIKMCKGQMFKTCDMNSKNYSVWVLFGVLNNTMHVLKVEIREPYKPKLYGTNVKNIIDETECLKAKIWQLQADVKELKKLAPAKKGVV